MILKINGLEFSYNHFTFCCYGFLHIITKRNIKKYPLFSNYQPIFNFLVTMFYLIENQYFFLN